MSDIISSVPTLVRCACVSCGAHVNAICSRGVRGSCLNCGSVELALVPGAEPLVDELFPALA